MRAIERAGYLAHSRSPAHQRRLARAEKIICDMLARCQAPYVACSFGKDSSCLLWLVLQHVPDIPVRILTSGETRLLHANLDEVMDWWRARYPKMDLQEILVDRVFSAEWQEADWTEQRKAGRRDIVNRLPTSGDFDGVFMGLRDEESNRRRLATHKNGPIRHTAGMWCAVPLADWLTDDIGAMTCVHNLPLLEAYEAEGLDTRTTMRLTGDAVRQNGFIHLRMRDPGAYNRLLQRFPELAAWDG